MSLPMEFSFISGPTSHKIIIIFPLLTFIDEDGDEISIIDDDDLRILADGHKSTPIKLNVRSLEAENAAKEKSPEQAAKSSKTHSESANSATSKYLYIY